MEVVTMHGGVILFRGTGADALRYVESDRSRADDYYLGDGTGIQYTVLDASGDAVLVRSLTADAYNGWVDWISPDTGERMGGPRLAGVDRLGSPRFAEMTINAPKSLSIAAALHPEVSAALDAAQQNALSEIQRWLAEHSVTRVGPRGTQEVVPVERMQVVGITHRTSRAGDPHRHIHMQVGTRVWAAGKWRALDTGALFKQQGAIRALGTAVIAAHPELAVALDRHGLTLNPVTSEVAELDQFNVLMSKRGEQVRKNLARLEAEWDATHPGEAMGPVVSSRLTAQAWAYERPAKKPTTLREEAAWLAELHEAGYDPATLPRAAQPVPASLDELSVQDVAMRALDRCAAGASAWTPHSVQEHVTRIITEAGVRGTPEDLRALIAVATSLALEDCSSILPPSSATPEHVAHLTSLRVVQAEMELRDLIIARVSEHEPWHPDVRQSAEALRQHLDPGQLEAAAAVASADPLVVVEGAAGAGKTTMLATAIHAAEAQGRAVRVVAPTKRAAEVANLELGVPAESVAALAHAHGWRWNKDGVWTRLTSGDTDPVSGTSYTGPPPDSRLQPGERIVVDEAGMLDQDTALALFTIAAETGATLALVGDRAQLPAVGRGGVLDMAAQLRGRIFNMTEVHRFPDPIYAEVTLRMRDRQNPGESFDQLWQLGLIHLHADADELRERLAESRQDGEVVTVASNAAAALLNDRIRDERLTHGLIDDTTRATGSDGSSIGRGDLIQTRWNDTGLGVANRQQWIVQHVEPDGAVWVRDAHDDRKREHTVHLPAEYVREHTHLSYAATAYGIQGVTATASHTILTDGMDGAALYVGMTRGRAENALHVVAESVADARAQFVDAMERDHADRGLTHATERATEAVQGLVNEGPARLVQTERVRLTQIIERAEQQAAVFGEAAARFAAQKQAHHVETQEHTELVAHAKEIVEQTRHAVTAEVEPRARADGQELAAMRARLNDAREESRVARFGRRRAAIRSSDAAVESVERIERRIAQTWGAAPSPWRSVNEWAEMIAAQQADAHPAVHEAEHAFNDAQEEKRQTSAQQASERTSLTIEVYGTEQARQMRGTFRVPNPRSDAERARQRAAEARQVVAELDARSVAEATEWLTQRREQQRIQREALQTRQEALARHDAGPTSTGSDQHRGRPGLSL